MSRNFQELNTLKIEGNELKEINSITLGIFPKLALLGISKNLFSCDYLATFLPPMPRIKYFIYPTNETNIDGIECQHDQNASEITSSGAVMNNASMNTKTHNMDLSFLHLMN